MEDDFNTVTLMLDIGDGHIIEQDISVNVLNVACITSQDSVLTCQDLNVKPASDTTSAFLLAAMGLAVFRRAKLAFPKMDLPFLRDLRAQPA